MEALRETPTQKWAQHEMCGSFNDGIEVQLLKAQNYYLVGG